LTWHETHGYPISGRFELYADIQDSIRHWFGTPTLVDRFGVFGNGPDGSLFTFGARRPTTMTGAARFVA